MEYDNNHFIIASRAYSLHAFVEYKTSEAAKRRSKINKKNVAKKKYHHTMGQGGYKSGKPK
jgi:hypothetical protein